MTVTDNDLELLEAYLDDALDVAESEPLRARLATDPQLVSALDHLRRERATRQAWFAALEPTDREIDHLSSRVHASLAHRRRFNALLRSTAAVSAAAACFLGGILVHATFFKTRSQQPPAAHPAVVEVYEVTLKDDSGNPVAVQRFDTLEKARNFANDLEQWKLRTNRRATAQYVLRAGRL